MTLQSLYNNFLKNPESRWIMQPFNAQLLYEFVKKNPIKKVLDLGTGIGASASIVALALKEKGEGHVDTVEQWDKCIKLANEMIPKELKEFITIHKSEVKVWQNPDIPYQDFSIFEKLPEGDYDFIIVDGPAMFLEDGKLVDLPNGDNMKMLIEGKIKPGTLILWDGRIVALKLLERYYQDNFLLHMIPPKGTDFSVLKRVDNEVNFKDVMLEEMNQTTTYFKEYGKP